MAEIIIPGTDKVLLDGTILIFADYGTTKYIAHNGYYNYAGEQHSGWYGVSVPYQQIIPIVVDMLIRCEVVYYPDSNCTCRYPSGNIPFTTDDKFQLLRAFITVDTMIERDALAPNLIPADLPNGKIVRVNRPNNEDFDPKYYIYKYSQDLTSAAWDYFDIYFKPDTGIPKSDLSEDVQHSLDLTDSALQEVPSYYLNWYETPSQSQIDANLEVINQFRNLEIGKYFVFLNVGNHVLPLAEASNASGSIRVYFEQIYYPDVIYKYTISSTDSTNYSQDKSTSPESTFDAQSNAAGSMSATAGYISTRIGTSGNLDPSSFASASEVADIESKIPNAASAQNQLADKNFVNSSIATNTANFIGTFSSVEELEAYSGTLTNNDYAFVTEVTAGQVTAYERWKYNATQQAWLYEYTLNNSSFTSDQWAAINSTITAELVTAYSGHIADTTIHVTAADKQTWNSKVTSVNNKTGVVTLSYSDVGADPDGAALAVSQQLNTHASDTHIHTNDNEKHAWYARAILTVSGEDLIISYIESPTISLSESTVSWSPVYNATSYKVYADNGETTELVATVTTTSIDLADYISTDGTYTVTVLAHSDTYGDSANSNSVKWILRTVSYVLDENSWDVISGVSSDGLGANYWAVGDMKQIHLEGTAGTLSLNTDLNVYIMGFDHNSALEGTGITFGSFKTTDSSHTDVALVDSQYDGMFSDGRKCFNMNHWSNSSYSNYGGWAGCDMRYDILGSTDVAPSGYGAAPTTSRVGYDATSTCATSPIANTLMSCLPSELRAVMKPMTKYTDNARSSYHNSEANVTASVDYLPFLAEYEIFGSRTYANQYEYKKQAQYAYYVVGNSKMKYKHNKTGTIANWWGRSPYYTDGYAFCSVYSFNSGLANVSNAWVVYGISPIFLI